MPNHASTDNQTLLGFDFGLKRIGVAVGQTVTETASVLSTLHAEKGEPNWQEVEKLLKEWKPHALVVGIPTNMDGTGQTITGAAKNFANALRRFDLPVYEVDERLTTKEARQQLFAEGGYRAIQAAQVDSVAAKLILESWLRKK
jgi:putative Holliday junction resolvase